ncbi:alcohol dehydrogenase [Intrasporangium chromatireducens Q5-1]|uniref:Alcohol dehydrogenase n=1 Tax=Intrasporangium chromatireducens Q5-1 TaxID=584657 RepID=W9GMQ8_9MICO|nr:alcohol dehydrogenase catalytic domain-containing protein [Intrasporangium chromatireducens]EWT06397.1 alcohol dehydrogenase [Intrasporangium chromatireducens Q5-1]
MRAAVVWEAGGPFEVRDDVERRDPTEHEVVVRIRAAGLCQTDLSLAGGAFGQPMPVVLGHEGAGEILALGSAVTGMSVGDRVLVNWVPSCGRCYTCVRGQTHICRTRRRASEQGLSRDLVAGGREITVGMGTATFAEEAILPANGVVPLPDDVPFTVAALMGCALPTGIGAATRAADVQPGDTVVVVGCGPVGLSAIQGARIAGAATILAVDPTSARRNAASRLGATHTATPEEFTAGGFPDDLDAGGFDIGIDAVGRAATIRTTWNRVRRGGSVVVVGAAADGDVPFTAQELFHEEKVIRGSFFGSGDQRREVPRMSDLWRRGLLHIEGMIEASVDLAEINDVAQRQRRGDIVRAVLTL